MMMIMIFGLDLSKNKELYVIACYVNQLTSLDIDNNSELRSIYCGDNQITSLDVSNNTLLETLHCEDNQLTSLKANNGRILSFDANNNPNLYCVEVFEGTTPQLLWQDAHDSQFTWSEDCDY